MARPLILITNDDGIAAPGLHALRREMQKAGDVVVVAPSEERSAVGHAITISDPLRVRRFEKNGKFFGYAVSGTPADCVKIAYWALLDRRPDVLVSGINLGSNTGINVIYSGTVSAATEGAILNIPSCAVSLATFRNPDFAYAAKFARKLTLKLLIEGLPSGIYLNVNVPNCAPEKIQGVSVTAQGRALFEEHFDKRIDPHGSTYYWLTGQKIHQESGIETDDSAIQSRWISVTPVHFDLTAYSFLEPLKKWKMKP